MVILHIGHVKAIVLNFNLGESIMPLLILRLTIPTQQKKSTVCEAIKKDIRWLGYEWDKECYASDYFDNFLLGQRT